MHNGDQNANLIAKDSRNNNKIRYDVNVISDQSANCAVVLYNKKDRHK